MVATLKFTGFAHCTCKLIFSALFQIFLSRLNFRPPLFWFKFSFQYQLLKWLSHTYKFLPQKPFTFPVTESMIQTVCSDMVPTTSALRKTLDESNVL